MTTQPPDGTYAGPLTRPWPRAAAAVVAGALPALTFPTPSLWWLAYVALVPWLSLIRTAPCARRAALDGWLGGGGFLLAVHHWLLPSLHVFILVLAALLGLLWAPWGVLVKRLMGGSPGPARAAAALFAVPSGWLMVELARSWEYLGGPWGLFGASQWQVAPALKLASTGGIWLVTFLLVALNTAVSTVIWASRARITGLVGLVGCAAVVAGVWWWAPSPRPAGTVRIALVQPGVVDGAGSVQHRFDRQEELTRKLAGQRVDLVVWGESGVGGDLAQHPGLRDRLTALSRAVGADLLVNVDARRSDRPGIFKSSVLVGPGGPTGERYDKMRLVPFGEYVPARSLLGWATSVGRAAGEDRMRGERPVVMRLPASPSAPEGLRIGPLVCFESAFPDMSRQLARDGAQVIVAQSSTSTFQQSWAPWQHASLAALRAAETWRPVVHATLTGVSTVAGPQGRAVGAPLGTDRSEAAVREVPLARGTSPYVRYGDWVVLVSLAVVACTCAAEGVRLMRRNVRKPARKRP
ncbi:apolipoprotein N-acyltransferase [Streptomyces rectiverticillatus]|uniref:apolipoprotein N-acyltransferase n=1 Tax=Streptomyces rectiverticillatus TaxID=173860 RepID=UPI0015C2F461|nr:apolipoprotein N-acyltransferase [Streptomyces rectiverticillatus]QLE70982.1 apolipoprotein N-acyltransferase [Streptomyces rectiverticillatus]